MNATSGMNARLHQQQQQQEARERTHEPICVKETRVCWIEFGVSLACLVLGIIFVFAGVSADSSAVGSSGGSAGKPAGIVAVTYIGVALLVIGTALLIVFGVHFHRVKVRLDAVKAQGFAQLGIQPSSRYQQLPTQPAAAADFGGPPRSLPRPPPLPLPPRQQQQQQPHQQPKQQRQQQQQVPKDHRPLPHQMSSSRLQPMPPYREGAFYNLGFLGDETEARPSPQPTVATISTGKAQPPSQHQSVGLQLGRNAPLRSPTSEISKQTPSAGTTVDNTRHGPSAQYNAPPPADHTRHGPSAQYNAPPPADHTRHGPSAQYNAPPPADHTRHGPSAQYNALPPADHTRHGPSAQYNAPPPADHTRHGPSAQYAPPQADHTRHGPSAQYTAPTQETYNKHGLQVSFDVPPPAVHTKPGFSRGLSDAPPAGSTTTAVGVVQSSRSYHSGFLDSATVQTKTARHLPSSASGQDFQARTTSPESSWQAIRAGRSHEEPRLPSWQQPPVETPPPQRSPPPGYALDPLPLLRQPLRDGHGGQQQQLQQQQQPKRQQPSGYRSSQI